MTTNQTIDGVPRRLIELSEQMANNSGYLMARDELRALLDAKRCDSCDDSGDLIDLTGEWRGYCVCHIGVALKNKPQQGEPVAKLNWEQIVGLVNGVLGCEAHKWPLPDAGHVMTGINFNSLARIIDRVQAEQHAPVTVVLPECRNERDHAGDFTYEAKAWNACLDEVKRLNK